MTVLMQEKQQRGYNCKVMTIEELKAIVNNCETDPKRRVMVKVKLDDSRYANAEIISFGTYVDGLLLNVEI